MLMQQDNNYGIDVYKECLALIIIQIVMGMSRYYDFFISGLLQVQLAAGFLNREIQQHSHQNLIGYREVVKPCSCFGQEECQKLSIFWVSELTTETGHVVPLFQKPKGLVDNNSQMNYAPRDTQQLLQVISNRSALTDSE